jgi:hypothetical protein
VASMYQGLGYDLQVPVQAVAAAGLFVSLASFLRRPTQSGVPQVDSLGQVDATPADYVSVGDMTNIPCMLAVYSPYRPNIAGVVRKVESFEDLAERHLLLNGYYTDILRSDLVNVDGVIYQIQSGAEWDSQHTMTRLAVRTFTQ